MTVRISSQTQVLANSPGVWSQDFTITLILFNGMDVGRWSYWMEAQCGLSYHIICVCWWEFGVVQWWRHRQDIHKEVCIWQTAWQCTTESIGLYPISTQDDLFVITFGIVPYWFMQLVTLLYPANYFLSSLSSKTYLSKNRKNKPSDFPWREYHQRKISHIKVSCFFCDNMLT